MPLTRYLLSHNHDISDAIAPAIERQDFAQLFQSAIAASSQDGPVAVIDHPHWRAELKTSSAPATAGEFLAHALKTYREQQLGQAIDYRILILGGLKTTPATSSNPNALQTGEWGVDIVETPNAEDFLSKLNWTGLVSLRAPQEIIEVIL